MLVSTRIPANPPRREKKPTTVELRNISRLEIIGCGYQREDDHFLAVRNKTRVPKKTNSVLTIPGTVHEIGSAVSDPFRFLTSVASLLDCNSTMNGVDAIKRNTINTGEVPKLNSKQPSARKASKHAMAASTSQTRCLASGPRISSRRIRNACQPNAAINHTHAARKANLARQLVG